jgi:hypothetical protein
MACFATPYGLRYAAHCFKRADAQNNRPALIPAGGKLGVTSDVQDGGNAQAAYLEAISIAGDEQRRRAIDAALKDYCGRDTWAIMAIYRRFMGLQIPAAQLPIKANLN